MLSIIIVNYNVKYFLEQCLYSLRKSMKGVESEIIVLDNQSTDGSIDYLSTRFPEVRFIANEENLGFARACNKGLVYARGEYVLFLNPDTLLGEDSLKVCLDFFEKHPDAGALGVKMIDGSGKFLKESKRAFPGPLTSLYKLFGLSRLFPRSPIFSRYYLGHLSNGKNAEVDVLAGAFMMIKKEVLDKTGAFDEDFFMYGEDIDLSYRIQKAGYKNYYLAETSIIHFKGESTKHGSLNYVRMFYTAMSIFVKKHYGGSKAGVFDVLLHFAIWLRAFISASAKFVRWIGLPFIDALIILFSFWMTKAFWSAFIKPDTVYSYDLLWIAFPAYTVVYLTVAYYAGLYQKFYQRSHLVRSMLSATLVLLAGYALLPEKFRFSRGIILLGSLVAFTLISLFRVLLLKTGFLQKKRTPNAKPYLLVAANSSEFEGVKMFLSKRDEIETIIGRVAINGGEEKAVGRLESLPDLIPALGAEELVFIAGQLSYRQIIQHISTQKFGLRLRFQAAGSCSIVGSDTDKGTGETITSETRFNLDQPAKRRVKRLIDVLVASILLLLFPLVFLLIKLPLHCLQNCFEVILGKKTWIGYIFTDSSLPALRPSVLGVNGRKSGDASHMSRETIDSIDYWYAKNYEPMQDLRLIVKNYQHLGT